MPLRFGTDAIADIKVGSSQVDRVYMGDVQIWPEARLSPVLLAFTGSLLTYNFPLQKLGLIERSLTTKLTRTGVATLHNRNIYYVYGVSDEQEGLAVYDLRTEAASVIGNTLDWVSLASHDDVLYGIVNEGSANFGFHSINTDTGASTRIASIGSARGDMASHDGVLYLNNNRQLHTIDVTTGTVTRVGSAPDLPGGALSSAIGSYNDQLYMINTSGLYTLNTTTGVHTPVPVSYTHLTLPTICSV